MRTVEGAKLIYELQPGETWCFYKRDNGCTTIIVAHPERKPKIIKSDGSIEILEPHP